MVGDGSVEEVVDFWGGHGGGGGGSGGGGQQERWELDCWGDCVRAEGVAVVQCPYAYRVPVPIVGLARR